MPVRTASVRPLAAPVAVAAAVAVGTAVVAFVDPAQPGRYPACPILAVTGLYCPGCGGLRAVHALAHGDVAQAWDLNALLILAIPLAVAAYLLWVRARLRGALPGQPVPRRPWMRTVPVAAGAIAALVVSLGFAVARNLPAFAALAP